MFLNQSLVLSFSLGMNHTIIRSQVNAQKCFRNPSSDDILHEIPTYYFTMDYVLNNLETLIIPSRCSAVIFKDLNGGQIQGFYDVLSSNY